MRGVTKGNMSQREKDLSNFLGKNIADWIEKHETSRDELLCAISPIICVLFIDESPYKDDIHKKLQDIDDFCNFLKFVAKK